MMTPEEEDFHRNMADINLLCAEIEYAESTSTSAYVAMLLARSSRDHSPAYASGSIVGKYVMEQARARDRTALLMAVVLYKGAQWIKANAAS